MQFNIEDDGMYAVSPKEMVPALLRNFLKDP